jgi:beta-lactamase superfamily II metal-dependent hydrolase
MFNIHFLPARYGDCIWITYKNNSKIFRILIDGGTAGTRKDILSLIDPIPKRERELELCVVTHIDRDHIEGILGLLRENPPIKINDIWFNGYKHLKGPDSVETLGALQGEQLTEAIQERELSWNYTYFNGKSVAINKTDLPKIHLSGGMILTVLSPSFDQLEKLKPKWLKEVTKAGLIPGISAEEPEPGTEIFGSGIPDVEKLAKSPFQEDKAEANGSSIALMAEFGDKRILLAGDAHPSRILESLHILQPEGRIKIDLVKLAHHGSSGNTSPQLLEKIDCTRFVFSTNGSIFNHPSQDTVARVLKSNQNEKELVFNYKTPHNAMWDSEALKLTYKYKTRYPPEDAGIEIKLV